MDVYFFNADIFCKDCGEELIKFCEAKERPAQFLMQDSNFWPQGPVADGGGEADCPQHCGRCRAFLENPLTGDGYKYVREAAEKYISGDDAGFDWPMVADRIIADIEAAEAAGETGKADALRHCLLEWVRFYGPEMD